MSDATRFTIYCCTIVLSLVAAYAGRSHGVFKESWARPIHHFVLVYTWTVTYLMGTWFQPIRIESAWVPVLILATISLPALLMRVVAKKAGLPGKQVGVTVVAAAISNTGFTLGAYLCYLMYERGEDALGYGATWGALNVFGLVLVVYPIVRRYGELDEPGVSNARMILRSFTTLPAMPMYGALVGWGLAIAKVPRPAFISDFHVMDVLTFIVCVGSYFGIGLTIRLGETLQYLRGHMLVAVASFIVGPAVMGLMILLTRATARPIDPFGGEVLFVLSFMPAGVSTVLVANIFHLDARMAGNVWLWNTVGFLVVGLPIMWWVVT